MKSIFTVLELTEFDSVDKFTLFSRKEIKENSSMVSHVSEHDFGGHD